MSEEAVHDVDSNPEGLGQHVVAKVNLEEPVDKCLTHSPGDLVLVIHVCRARHDVVLTVERNQKISAERT
jgi:hypothetical protein